MRAGAANELRGYFSSMIYLTTSNTGYVCVSVFFSSKKIHGSDCRSGPPIYKKVLFINLRLKIKKPEAFPFVRFPNTSLLSATGDRSPDSIA